MPEPKDGKALGAVLQELGIDSYDLLLVGDGSGSRWGYACGWGVVAVEPVTGVRHVLFGGMNQGTVNVAELMAYVHALLWYAGREDVRAQKRARHIHIITDSQYCRTRGDSPNLDFKTNKLLWAVLELIERQGFVLHWHQVARDSVALNTFADLVSKSARMVVQHHNMQSCGRPEDFNPW